jgi:hypothetical protein
MRKMQIHFARSWVLVLTFAGGLFALDPVELSWELLSSPVQPYYNFAPRLGFAFGTRTGLTSGLEHRGGISGSIFESGHFSYLGAIFGGHRWVKTGVKARIHSKYWGLSSGVVRDIEKEPPLLTGGLRITRHRYSDTRFDDQQMFGLATGAVASVNVELGLGKNGRINPPPPEPSRRPGHAESNFLSVDPRRPYL